MAGIELIAVIVRDVTETEAETLRIEENLRRRTLKSSETARAIHRLYELREVKQGPREEIITLGNNSTPQEDISFQTGLSVKQVSVLNTIGENLIKPLMDLLDAHLITQKEAYKLAQMAGDDQEIVDGNKRACVLGAINKAHARTSATGGRRSAGWLLW